MADFKKVGSGAREQGNPGIERDFHCNLHKSTVSRIQIQTLEQEIIGINFHSLESLPVSSFS